MQNSRTAIVSGGMLLQQVSMFITGVVIGRTLGADDFGMFTLLRNGTLWLLPLTSLGLDLAIQKHAGRGGGVEAFLPVYRALRFIVASLNLSLLLIVLFAAAVQPNQPAWLHIALAVMALPFLSDALLASGYMRSRARLVTFSLLNDYMQAVCRAVLTLLAVLMGPTLTLMLVVNVVVAMIAWLALALYQIRLHLNGNAMLAGIQASWLKARLIIAESLWMALSVLTYGSLRVADLFALGFFVPPEQLGAYSAISAVATFVRLVPLALSQSLGAQVSHQFDVGNFPEIQRLIRDNTYLSVVAGSFAFAGIAAFGQYLHLIFGDTFIFDSLLCFLLPLSWLVSSVLTPTGLVLSMTSYHRRESMLLIGGAILMLVLLLLLVPSLGALGAAIASTTCFFIINTVRLFMAQSIIGLRLLKAKTIVPPLVALAISYSLLGAVTALIPVSIFSIALGCIVYSILYWSLYFREFVKQARH